MLSRTARRSLIVTSTVALFVGGLLGASPAQAAKPAPQDLLPITIVVPSETSTSRTITVTYRIEVKPSANVQFSCVFGDVAQETYFAYDCGTVTVGKKAVTGTVTHTVNGDGEFYFDIAGNAKGFANTEVFETFTVNSGGGGGGGDPQTALDLCNSLGGGYNSGAALPAGLPAPFDNDQSQWNCTGLASGSLLNAEQTDYSATGQAFQNFCVATGGTRVLAFGDFPTPGSETAWCVLEVV